MIALYNLWDDRTVCARIGLPCIDISISIIITTPLLHLSQHILQISYKNSIHHNGQKIDV